MLKRVPVYLQTQDAVKSFIEAHSLGPGDPLPSEAALSQELGISRASLREGIKSLEALGIVEVRHGEGIFVKAFSFDSIFNNLPYSFAVDGRSLHDLMQVRGALEEGLMAMLVTRIDAASVQRLEALLEAMQVKAERGRTFEEEDHNFHRELYSSLNNPFVVRLVDLFWELFHRLHGRDLIAQPALLQSVREHRAIVEALKRGDAAATTTAMRDHFANVRQRVEQEEARKA